MHNPHKGWPAQQILDHWPHPIAQPDTEETRQARVAQRFRLYFLGEVEVGFHALGKRNLGPKKQASARKLLAEAEQAKTLLHEPQNAFLVKGHAAPMEDLLARLRELVASFA